MGIKHILATMISITVATFATLMAASVPRGPDSTQQTGDTTDIYYDR